MNDTSQTTSCGANGRLGQFAGVGALEHGHARIVAEPRVQLAVADVEGHDARGAALEQDVGEPAGRCADIEAVEPRRIDAGCFERVRELLAAARDVTRRLRHRELRRLVHLLAGLRVARHEACEDERLRLRAALGQPTLDEQHVEPLLRHG